MWQRAGARFGKHIIWLGRPIVSIAPGSTLGIGSNCLICSRASQTALGVNHPVILRTLRPGAKLIVGSGVRMSGTTICAAESITIGDRCVIGANVTIVDTDFHALDAVARASQDDFHFTTHKPVEIDDDVFIGGNSLILKGVKIGRQAVIGAGSIVVKDIPAGMMAAGNPAVVIGSSVPKAAGG